MIFKQNIKAEAPKKIIKTVRYEATIPKNETNIERHAQS
jgi:hypothetical protein